MTDQERCHQYELQRQNTLRNYAYSIRNLGRGSSLAPAGSFEEDVEDLGSTTIVFKDGTTESFVWKGEITIDTMIEAGLYSEDDGWIRNPARVEIGTDVTGLGEYLFYECETLSAIRIPSGAKTVGDHTFSHCTALTGVTIPSGTESVGDGAFFYCSSLEAVTIPGSVAEIGGQAFYQCAALSAVTMGEGVEIIGEEAFFGCASLKAVKIPSTTKTVGKGVFSDCTLLKNAEIPSGTESVGEDAFAYTGMTQIVAVSPGTVPPEGSLAFIGWSIEDVQSMENYPFGIYISS